MLSPLLSLERVFQQALLAAGTVSTAKSDLILEDLRLRFEYPDEYVAYIDTFSVENAVTRMTRRVLAHSCRLRDVHRVLKTCSADERAALNLDYIEPVDARFQTRDDHSD